MTENESLPKGKNIVIFSDGTGQEGGVKYNTNVYKLFSMIEDRTNEQIAFYDPGLGADWHQFTGKVIGVGIEENILQCYQFISDHYQWMDRIFLFGFSRGATTVRSLSGFIAMFGILPHSRPELVKKAWRIYQDPSSRDTKRWEFLSKNPTTWCNIEFIGVWDTVRALMPSKSYLDLKLGDNVRYAYHAMSIDEDRKAFVLEPFVTVGDDGESLLGPVTEDPKYIQQLDELKPKQQIVRQVWFCGVHTDVGGGYEEIALSNIPLLWMVDRAIDRSVLEHPLKLNWINFVEKKQNSGEKLHSERGTWWGKVKFREGGRTWVPAKCGKPIIHKSVLDRYELYKDPKDPNHYNPWILKQFKTTDEYEIEPWENEGRKDEFDSPYGPVWAREAAILVRDRRNPPPKS